MTRALRCFVFGVLLVGVTGILSSLGSISFFTLSFCQILIPLATLLFFTRLLYQRQLSGVDFLFPWLAGFLTWILIQTAGQILRLPFFALAGPWEPRLNLFKLFVTGVCFYALASGVLRTRKAMNRYLAFLVGASVILAVFYITVVSTSDRPVESVTLPALAVPILASWLGVSLQPNNVVDLFYPALFYALALSLYFYKRKNNSRLFAKTYAQVLLYLCFGCVLTAALLATQSRAGILAFLGGVAVFSLCYPFVHHRRWQALTYLGVSFLIIAFFLFLFGVRETTKELSTVWESIVEEIEMKGSRSMTIGASLAMVREHGLMGVGLGQFQFSWVYYHRPPFNMFPERSYNDLLWLWAEAGLPGILLFGGGLLVFFGRCLSTAVRSESYYISYLLLACMASTISLILHSFVDPTMYVAHLYWLFLLNLGIGAGLWHLERAETGREGGDTLFKKKGRGWREGLTVIVMLSAAGTVFLSATELFAHIRAQQGSEVALRQAMQWAPFNASYPTKLAEYYEKRFEQTGSIGDLLQFRRAIDQALELDPLRLTLYLKRAEVFHQARQTDEVQKTFDLLFERLPDFYLAHLMVSAFYLTRAVEAERPGEMAKLERKAWAHYQKARQLYPNLNPHHDYYGFMTREAVARFVQLEREHQTTSPNLKIDKQEITSQSLV